jgi:hypothetical protein
MTLGARSRIQAAMQMSRSVIIPTRRPSPPSTGTEPQSQSHICLAAALHGSSALQVATCFVINSTTFMARTGAQLLGCPAPPPSPPCFGPREMRRGFTSGRFGTVMSRTPSFMSARTLSASAPSGRVNDLEKLPYDLS